MQKETYKLYYSPAACSLAVHAVLNAINADFELIKTRIDGKENHTEAYLRLSPLGQVPVLIASDRVLRESAAIIVYLLENAGHALLPGGGDVRTKALQWLFFCNSTLQQAYGAYFLITNNLKDKETAAPALQLISKRIHKLWRYVDSQIESRFICGEEPTAADILMATIANWSFLIVPSFSMPDKARALCASVSKLPYFAKALTTEGVEYKIP